MSASIPYLEERVPRARAEGVAHVVDAQARDAIVVAGQLTDAFLLEGVPDDAREVVVATKEQPPGFAERDRGDTAHDRFVAELTDLLVRAYIKEFTGSIVRSSYKRVIVGEERNSVNVGLMAGK